MKGESNRRGFLREAALAGAALAAGVGGLSASGCRNEELEKAKAEAERLRVENEALLARVQVRIDEHGNLEVLDAQLGDQLGEIWKQQEGKPHVSDPTGAPRPLPGNQHPRRRGIHVRFDYEKEAAATGTPPDKEKINSLCSC